MGQGGFLPVIRRQDWSKIAISKEPDDEAFEGSACRAPHLLFDDLETYLREIKQSPWGYKARAC